MTIETAKEAVALLQKISDQEHFRHNFEMFLTTIQDVNQTMVLDFKKDEKDPGFRVSVSPTYVRNVIERFIEGAEDNIIKFKEQLEAL